MGEKMRHHFSWEKLLGVLFVLIANSANIMQAQAHNAPPALFAFGDSILDTGNNNNLIAITKCNFPPYGKNFKGGQPTGRFSDGKVLSDLIAGALGIKESLPAYLSSKLSNEDILTGVSFASGGSGVDLFTAQIQGVLTLADQLGNFKEYIGRLKRIAGEEKANSIISNSVYLFSSGNNDIAISYTSRRRIEYAFPAYANLLVGGASNFLKDLYGLGARRVWVLSTLPLGCLPAFRVALAGRCLGIKNEQAKLFNSKLSSELDRLRGNLTGYKLDFIDVYTPLLDIINNPSQAGFTDVVNGCCGSGTIEIGQVCRLINHILCPNTLTHVFWDGGHPTEKAYQVVVSKLISKFPSY